MEQKQKIDLSIWSDDNLKEIVIKRTYRGSMISAAKNELEKRGVSLTVDELEQRDTIREFKIKRASKSSNPFKIFYWDADNIVTDESAPMLYTRRVLYLFSIIFFVLFGAIMFSMNLARLKKYKYIVIVLLYSVLYTGVIIYIQNTIEVKISTFLLNAIGYLPIDLMCGKFTGKTKYRKRNIIFPLIIGITLTGLFLWAMIYQ